VSAGTAQTDGGELIHSARWIEALDRQSTIIMAIFARAGFEPVAPPVIQPADVFLDLIGEDLRQRTYVFTDPEGEELCLRPDLTIPTCRLYLARHGRTGDGRPAPPRSARFAYNGVVFRYQPTGGTIARPREFRQAGIESFAAADPARSDAETLALTIEAVRASGLRAFRLHVGDIAIFRALLDAIAMPGRWRARLMHHFRHPEAFRRELGRLVRQGEASGRAREEALLQVGALAEPEAVAFLEAHLAAAGCTIAGTRSLEEIAERLKERALDAATAPLAPEAARLIETYLAIEAPAQEAAARIAKLTEAAGIDIAPALEAYETRLKLFAEEGVDVSQARFSAGFGRAFEYYTGFVFELLAPALEAQTPIAGGGRYDTLVEAISAGERVPAVGSAIHADRLLLAVRGGTP
jgi:ATP phosphoribosyltransferase regulatory subunit